MYCLAVASLARMPPVNLKGKRAIRRPINLPGCQVQNETLHILSFFLFQLLPLSLPQRLKSHLVFLMRRHRLKMVQGLS